MLLTEYDVETVVCLVNKNAKPMDYVDIGVNAEDYYISFFEMYYEIIYKTHKLDCFDFIGRFDPHGDWARLTKTTRFLEFVFCSYRCD